MAEKPARSASPDDLGQFLTFGLAAIACAFLATLYTGPALIGSACVLLLSWFLGQQEREFPLILVVAASSIIIAFFFASSSGVHIVADWLHSYYIGLERSGWGGIYRAWLDTFSRSNGWQLAVPIGICAASAVILVRDARRKSLSARLMQAGHPLPSCPAPPIVLLRRWWVRRRPHIVGSVTIGCDLKTGARVAVSIDDLARMMLVVGATGAGKTNSLKLLLEAWLRHGLPAIYVCGKGDSALARTTYTFARSLGRTAYLFDANDPVQSCTYNPVAHGDATSCADRIMEMGDYSDPFYEKRCRGFAQTVFRTLAASGHRVDLLQAANYLDTKSLLAALRRKGTKDRDIAQALANDIAEQRDAEKDISGLRAEIRNLAKSSLAKLFDSRRSDRPCINLKQARAESAYVHFVLPSLSYPKWAKQLGRLIVNDIKAVVSTSNQPWLVILDEFHAYAGENVIPLVAMGRGFSVATVLSTQALSDLQRISPGGPNAAFADSLLGSLNLYLIHGLNSPADAEIAAALIGTASELELTAQTEANRLNELGSLRAVRSYRHHPDAIKTARLGEAIFVNKVRGVVAQVGVRLSAIEEQSDEKEGESNGKI